MIDRLCPSYLPLELNLEFWLVSFQVKAFEFDTVSNVRSAYKDKELKIYNESNPVSKG